MNQLLPPADKILSQIFHGWYFDTLLFKLSQYVPVQPVLPDTYHNQLREIYVIRRFPPQLPTLEPVHYLLFEMEPQA